nr:MAG TPA: hypothetical protein [Caudoviricetes sp.]
MTANCQLEPQPFCKNQQCSFQGRYFFEFLQDGNRFVIGTDNNAILASFHNGAVDFGLNGKYFHAAGFLGSGLLDFLSSSSIMDRMVPAALSAASALLFMSFFISSVWLDRRLKLQRNAA